MPEKKPIRAITDPTLSSDERRLLVVGANLRRARTRRGLSIERLASLSGISRAMISQIERGESAPTINVLWKLSRALNLPFAGLLPSRSNIGASIVRVGESTSFAGASGAMRSRALFAPEEGRRVEFYELRLAAASVENAEAHPPGTLENLAVASGCVEIELSDETYRLETGDAILFTADAPHSYRNAGPTEALMYLVMMYRMPELAEERT